MISFFLAVIGLLVSAQALPSPLKPLPNARIVGGSNAEMGDIPYQVIIYHLGVQICGGSVLSRGIIITAAQCCNGSISDYTVVAGELNTDLIESTEQTRQVGRIVIHENFDNWDKSNDIALMFLSAPFDLNEHIQPIALPSVINHTPTGNAVVSGWGTTNENGLSVNVLQKVSIPIISDRDCRNAYGVGQIRNSMICAGVPQGGLDACQGDLGGPMSASDTGTRYLAGIVSWGFGCGRPGYPGVYTEVSHFLSWIDRQV